MINFRFGDQVKVEQDHRHWIVLQELVSGHVIVWLKGSSETDIFHRDFLVLIRSARDSK